MLYRARPTNEGYVIERANAAPLSAHDDDILWSPLSTFDLDARAREVNAAARKAAGPGARLVALSGAWQTWSDATAAEAQS